MIAMIAIYMIATKKKVILTVLEYDFRYMCAALLSGKFFNGFFRYKHIENHRERRFIAVAF